MMMHPWYVMANVRDVVLMLTAIATVIAAFRGLSTWKQQLTGGAEHSLAKRILLLCFQYRDAIAYVRAPWMDGTEMRLSPDDDPSTMTEKDIHAKQIQNAYQARWEHVNKARSALYPELLEAEVLWGDTLNQLMKPLYQMQGNLFVAVQQQIQAQRDPHALDWQTDKDSTRMRETLYDPDQFAAELQAKLEGVASYLKTYLQQLQSWSLLNWIRRRFDRGKPRTSSGKSASDQADVG